METHGYRRELRTLVLSTFWNSFLKMPETSSFVYHSDFKFGSYSAIILQPVFINMLIL